MFDDEDSTDDVTCCYLQLEESLRINLADPCSRSGMSGKDLKQLYNRQKQMWDEQSSSSSSFDMYSDLAVPGPSGLQNKKRQNGDKSVGKFVNPKRTCLAEQFQRPHTSPDRRPTTSNGDISHSRKNTDLTTEPASYLTRNLLPGSTYEEHKEDSSESSDNVHWPDRGERPIQKDKQPKRLGLFSSPLPGGGQGVQFLDSTSEDDFQTRPSGALKGGRQSPEPSTSKMVLRRGIKRVLDSDDSDSEDFSPVGYRARPLIFSSSDSDNDSKPNQNPKGKVPKKTANPTFSSSVAYTIDDEPSFSRGRPKRTLFNPASNGHNDPPRGSSVISSRTGSSRRSKAQTNEPFHPPQLPARQEVPSFGIMDTIRNGPTAIPSWLDPSFNMGATSSNFRPPPFLSPSISLQSRSRNRGPPTRDAPGPSNVARRRGRPRSSKQPPNLAQAYPDVFADDSSEVEFFTANSYSDESNTESLSRQMGGWHNFHPSSGAGNSRSNPAINVASSEDEVSVVYFGPQTRSPHSRTGESRRRTPRTLGRRYNRRSRRSLPQNQGLSLSPDPVEQVRQVEEDERFARMLQAQFDSETDPTYAPPNHPPRNPPPPCHINIQELSSDEDSIGSLMDSLPPYVFPPHYGFPLFTTALERNPTYHNQQRHNGSAAANRRRGSYHLSWYDQLPAIDLNFNGDSYEALLGLAEMNGDVTRGLLKSQINRLPTRRFTKLPVASTSGATELPHKRAELNKECQVCLNDYVNGDVLRILPCFHEFHTPCIDPWLKINHTCPVCRVAVDLNE